MGLFRNVDVDQKNARACFKGEPVTPAPLADRLSIPSGPLFFPVTAYGPDGSVDLDVYRAHVRRGVRHGPEGAEP